MTPGIQPSNVKMMLRKKLAMRPVISTASGGNTTQKKYRSAFTNSSFSGQSSSSSPYCLLIHFSAIRNLRSLDSTANRDKVGAVASDVEAAIAEAKKALTEGGVERLNEAFNQLQTASHKLAEALYQQAPSPGAESSDQASAAGASSSSSGGDDNVIDAEYVDVDDNK